MNDIIVFIGVVLIAFFVVKRFVTIKRFNSTEEYLEYKKEKEEEDFLEDDEEWDDELIDKKSFNFLFVGAIATILFLFFGLFTGNTIYFILILFVITAILYLYYMPPSNKF
ncbi:MULTISPECIES: hypothetical protein [Myroides]|uniref:Uncharacterized protein n=1 Tax=Myroides albus TaxID=2562892 RepID=A0A6I3LIR7_9FLAO|nr:MULTISPECIES: hypothetical protein [Myroides]MTG98133.1 hypothetical protein [Myroides albus]MVX34732.1 hypothetical protein [Myroides sp. LoEW2-1]UVD78620.1 hypothetical protein NWE55_10840 [Myroides albus]